MAEPDLRTDWMNDPRNLTIGLLLLVVMLLGGMVLQERLPGMLEMETAAEGAGEPVQILDVVLDRDSLRSLDILFDRPVAEGRVGEVLGVDAATVRPPVSGVWRWEGDSVLRFEPAGGFGMAMEYDFALVPDRVLTPDKVLQGDGEFEVVTDQFQVERIDVYQEPAPEGDGVVVRGTVAFNYEVDPEQLAGQLRLVDPLRGASDPVSVSFETYWPQRVIQFRAEPVAKERRERELTLEIDSALTPAEGNVALTADVSRTVTIGSSENLAIWEVVPEPGDPESRLVLRLSSMVDPGIASRYLTVSPEVDYRLSTRRNELVLAGDFRPGSTYTLRVDEGLPARDEAVLRAAFSRTLRLPDLESRIDFESEGMFLSARGRRTLALEAVNVDRGQLVVERVYRNNLFYLFNSYSWMVWDDQPWSGTSIAHALGDRIVEATIGVAGERNRVRRVPLDVGSWVADEEPGLYRIAVARQGDYQARQRWVLVTDLGLVAKRAGDELLVWASSFSDLAPIAGARVEVISDQNQVIAQGRTDGNGLWRGDARTGSGTPWMITLERGDDFTFLLLDAMRVDTTGLDVGGSVPEDRGYEAFLYGERDLYRPGETVEGVALVRDRRLQPPPSMPLVMRHLDPTGVETARFRVEMDAQGLAPFDLEVPGYARTGAHDLELRAGERTIGRYRFQVEEFIPDRIRVDVSGPESGALGRELPFTVEAAYLFGPPAGDLPVEARIRLEASTFRPQGWREYSFADSRREFPGTEVFDADGRLDAQGRAEFAAPLPDDLRVPSSLTAVITARVQEEAGRGVASRHRVEVHPFPYYVGLRRASQGYADPGATESFEWVAVDPSGDLAEAARLRAELYREEWQTVLRRTSSGAFRYESTRDFRLVDSREIEPGEERGSFSFTPPQFGAYRVALADPVSGASTEVAFTASGAGFSPWAIDNPARVELELDRDEYRPGDVAQVQVRAPFAGRLLLTIERDGIREVQTGTLRGNTATLRVPVDGDLRPNAYVTATVVRTAGDLDPGAVGRAFGAVPIAVDRAANRIDVTVDHPEEIRPETPLTVRVDSEPGARLTVAAVDEGILQLIDQATPDPFGFFYRKLALGVATHDTFALLFPEVEIGDGAAVGGDAAARGMAPYVSTEGIRRVRPVALWSGVVDAGDDGVAEVTFDVPEFQGALRVMAVAAHGRRFGNASGFVRIRDPIVLLPTLPRFLSPRDQFTIPVTVRNDTGSGGVIDVRLTAELPGDGSVERADSVQVADGEQGRLDFTLRVGEDTGEARFELTASGMGETTEASEVLPVRPDLPAVTLEQAGTLEERDTTLALPEGSEFQGTPHRELRLGRLPTIQLAGRLEYLARYPYGCLEQVTSRAFPLIYLGDLAAELDPQLFEAASPAVMVQESVRRVTAFQHPTGGFSLWQGSEGFDPWASVYASHFLVEARRAGFLVPDAVFDRALEWLRGEVRARADYPWEQRQRVAYSLYVLARAGEPDLGTMDFLRQRYLSELRPESRALLAGAYAAAGNAGAVDDLVTGLQELEESPRQTGGNLNSPVRNRALLLLALLDASPGDDRVPTVALRLAREIRVGRWFNTQESAFALMALGQYFSDRAAQGDFSGRVLVGDREVGRFETGNTVLTDLDGTEPVRVVVEEGAPAAVHYSLRTRGVPTEASWEPVQEGLQVRRVFLSRDGDPVDLEAIGQGDLLAVRLQARSTAGPLDNVAIQSLLPAGLEVENPRLATSEVLPWAADGDMQPDHVDLRDDRILLFTSLPEAEWRTAYVLVRAVSPGRFRLPPMQAEAMYEPQIRAATGRGIVEVSQR